MENKNQEMRLLASSKTNRRIPAELELAKQGISVVDAEDKQIRIALGYGITLFGFSADKIPNKPEQKLVLLNYIKKNFPLITLPEIRNAFDYALEGRINVETKLYGNSFSAGYVSEILKKYLVLRDGITKPKVVHMTNIKKASNIFKILKENKPELYEELKSIGSTEKKKPDPNPLPNNDKFQRYMKEYDALRKDIDYKYGGRFVEYNGKKMSYDEYADCRLQEESGESN